MVKTIVQFKRAYRVLGERLFEQGHIESASHIYYLTHEEIGALLDGDASLALVARQRVKTFEYQKQLRVPITSQGGALPLESSTPGECGGIFSGQQVSGRTVCNGVVVAQACVATSLAEAKAIKQGEILITKATDVAWTPYFERVSGIVSDVGSTVSHGAVIAREYGIPCLVNTRTATEFVRSGDWVVLNATEGWLKTFNDEKEAKAWQE